MNVLYLHIIITFFPWSFDHSREMLITKQQISHDIAKNYFQLLPTSTLTVTFSVTLSVLGTSLLALQTENKKHINYEYSS